MVQIQYVDLFVCEGAAGAPGGQRAGVCQTEERAEGAQKHSVPPATSHSG